MNKLLYKRKLYNFICYINVMYYIIIIINYSNIEDILFVKNIERLVEIYYNMNII